MTQEELDQYIVGSAQCGDNESVLELLKQGANPNARDGVGRTVLRHVVEHHCYDVAVTLIQAGADVNISDIFNITPLMAAIVRFDKINMIKALIEAPGANLNSQTRDGDTVLMGAVKYGRMDATKLLIETGADTRIKNNDGDDVFAFARKAEKEEDSEIIKERIQEIIKYLDQVQLDQIDNKRNTKNKIITVLDRDIAQRLAASDRADTWI